MTGLTDIRNAIVAKILEVPDVGLVHGYMRHDSGNPRKAMQLFAVDKRIRTWMVRRISNQEKPDSSNFNITTHSWDIRFYMSLFDEEQTELVFDDLIEAVRRAFRRDHTLGDVVRTTVFDDQAGMVMLDSGPVMFFDNLCHGARLSLRTEVDESLLSDDPDEGDFVTAGVRYDLAPTDGAIDAEDQFQMETNQ